MKTRSRRTQVSAPLLGEPIKPGFNWSLGNDPIRAIKRVRVPEAPELIESLPREFLSRLIPGLIPAYRVDQQGLVVKAGGDVVSSLRWHDVQPGLTLSMQIGTEFEGYKAMPKLLTLHTCTPTNRVTRQRIALPKLREPLGISVHQNSWEIGRAALLQLIHNAPGPLLFSSDVFIDLQINPYTWKRARGPSLALHLYLIAMVASFFPLLQWATQFNLASGWLVMGLVLYALLTTVVGTTIATFFLPVYFGPSIVFCDQEGLFNRTPGHA